MRNAFTCTIALGFGRTGSEHFLVQNLGGDPHARFGTRQKYGERMKMNARRARMNTWRVIALIPQQKCEGPS
jgi:hypothetical protein